MTLHEFHAVTQTRIPTPAEFLAVVKGLGWRIQVGGDRYAALVAPRTDPVALKLAQLLGREPYRTNVLAEIGRHAAFDLPADDARPDTLALPAAEPAGVPADPQRVPRT